VDGLAIELAPEGCTIERFMNEETPLQNRIRMAVSQFSQGTSIALRNNTGMFVTFSGQKTRAGLGKGTSDLIGISSRVIQPEDVGKTVGVFLALEVKTGTGRASKEQIAFLDRVNALGGVGSVVRSPDEVESILASAPGALPKRQRD